MRTGVPLSWHLTLGWALVATQFALVSFHLPAADATIGESYLIFFAHFPSAVTSLLIFLASGVLSAAYLVRRNPRLDEAAAAAVDVGLLGCTITLVTGMIWAKAAWGIWWDSSDPRLLTVAILWLTYLAYATLRGAVEEAEKRRLYSAVFGILAALNVPLVHFALQLFRPVHHPRVVTMAEPSMVLTREFGALAFLCLYTGLWRLRRRAIEKREAIESMEALVVSRGF